MDNSFCLYRRYRPKSFDDLVGQDHIKRTLVNSILSNRFVHAYLFSGPRGTGKTSTARLLAKALNCRELDMTTAEPCGKCPCCEKIDEDNFLDIIEIDAASHTGIANVREEIQAKVGYLPSMGKKKVYIIDEVHMLSTAAFNGLLKTLEEPPSHVVFVLATTEPHKVPPTVSSRCQRFSFRRVSDMALVARLNHICSGEGIAAEEQALAAVARMAGGGARDAISLLDKVISFTGNRITYGDVSQALGIVSEEVQLQVVAAILDGDLATLVDLPATLDCEGFEMVRFAQELVYLAASGLRSLLANPVRNGAAASEAMSRSEPSGPNPFSGFSTGDMVLFIDLMSSALEKVKKAPDPLFQFQVELMRISKSISGKFADQNPAVGRTAFKTDRTLSAEQPAVECSSAKPSLAEPPSADEFDDYCPLPEITEPVRRKESVAVSPPVEIPAPSGLKAEPDSGKRGVVAEGFDGHASGNIRLAADSGITAKPSDGESDRPHTQHTSAGDAGILEAWPKILDTVRKTNPIVHALLKEGKPDSVSNGRLTILFDKTHEFHRKQLTQDQYLVVVEGVLNKIMDSNLKITFSSDAVEVKRGEKGEDDMRRDVMQDPKVRRILSICDGEIIKIIPRD